MKKYLYIFKTELMSTLQYISNVFAGYISYFILIFIFLNLWNYIYDDPAELINGYNKTQMIWYVIITEILYNIFKERKLNRRICDDVRGGNITYNMNKPYSYVGYILSSHLGQGFVMAIAYILIGMTLGKIFLDTFPTHSIGSILFVLISGLLAVIIDALCIIFISLISFYIEDAHPVYWIYNKFVIILGIMFPIEFFPPILQKFIAITPIYATCYGPAKLFVNFSLNEALGIIGYQLIYLTIAYGLCLLLYKKGVRKLNVNGG